MSSPHGPFSPGQEYAIETALRTCSAISLGACAFTLSTFLGSNLFQTPINRLLFYATFGNVMANVGEMVGMAGIRGGPQSAACRFQGLMLQWLWEFQPHSEIWFAFADIKSRRFVQADAMWSFCMALNVYLTFFHKYSISDLRNLELKYILFCYGLPFILTLVPIGMGMRPIGRAGVRPTPPSSLDTAPLTTKSHSDMVLDHA
jgi:hypothetical protein